MQRKTTWWRNLGGLLAACVLAMLVVIPTFSTAACRCDGDVATREATVQAVQGEGRHDSAPCEAACCLGGHCHHGAAMLDALVALLPTPILVAAEPLRAPTQALASRTTHDLERPPRA